MSSGVDFSGNGAEDVSQAPMTTGQPEAASRGQAGPIDFAGDGASDVKGTIEDTSEHGPMPPKGDGVVFAGDGALL